MTGHSVWVPTFPASIRRHARATVTDAASPRIARRARAKRARARAASIAMRVETDGERRTTGETDDEPGAVADAIDDARGGARAVWTCAYAESRGCVECFNLTLPCVGAARRGCVECLRCARARAPKAFHAPSSGGTDARQRQVKTLHASARLRVRARPHRARPAARVVDRIRDGARFVIRLARRPSFAVRLDAHRDRRRACSRTFRARASRDAR